MKQDLHKLLGELTPQQRQVVYLRFGLEDGKELSLAKIGQRMNISRERVRQLEQQALAHLKKKRGNVKEYILSS
jgi:RNA polymerase nonessential primary-like sigma factor